MSASLNPLRVDRTPLPPQLLLMAKLVALSLVLPGGAWGLLAALAVVSLFFNLLVRLGCLLLSAGLFESFRC